VNPEALIAYIDGGSRGNPGPAGFGVRVEAPDGSLVEEFHESIGVATNNIAEYRGLLAALEWALAHGQRQLHVRSDSQLLVQQMRGAYKVKHPGLQPLHAKAQQLAREIGRVTFEHVRRELNVHADRLANTAMDGGGPAESRPSTVNGPQSRPTAPPAAAVQPSPAKSHPFNTIERAVRLFIYRHFVETGGAPDVPAISKANRIGELDAAAVLHSLADRHAIVLAPASTNVWMAHPFSAVPTAYPVAARGRTYFANCAWDAAGILSMLEVDGECRTRCADCGQELSIRVRGGELEGDGIVHFAVPPHRFWDNVGYT